MYCKFKYRYITWNIEASDTGKKTKRIFVDFLAKIFESALKRFRRYSLKAAAHHIRVEDLYSTAGTGNSGRAVVEGVQYRTCARRRAHVTWPDHLRGNIQTKNSRQNCNVKVRRRSCFWKSKQSNPITCLDRPWGFQEAEVPRFQDSRYMTVVRLSAPSTDRLYPPGSIPGTHFL
jgi:hypothetical protein